MNPTEIIRSVLIGLDAELRANARLRWGVWLIVGILWTYSLLLLRDEVGARTTAYISAQNGVQRAKGMAQEAQWPSRLEAVRVVQLALEERLWREGTIGLAQAAFQDWLKLAAGQALLPKVAVSVAAREEGASEASTGGEKGAQDLRRGDLRVWKVSARIVCDFKAVALHEFLARIAANERTVVVESLAIRGAPVPRVDMVLVAYFQGPRADKEATAGSAKVQAN